MPLTRASQRRQRCPKRRHPIPMRRSCPSLQNESSGLGQGAEIPCDASKEKYGGTRRMWFRWAWLVAVLVGGQVCIAQQNPAQEPQSGSPSSTAGEPQEPL